MCSYIPIMFAPQFCSPRSSAKLGAVSTSSMHQDARIFDQARVCPQDFTGVVLGNVFKSWFWIVRPFLNRFISTDHIDFIWKGLSTVIVSSCSSQDSTTFRACLSYLEIHNLCLSRRVGKVQGKEEDPDPERVGKAETVWRTVMMLKSHQLPNRINRTRAGSVKGMKSCCN